MREPNWYVDPDDADQYRYWDGDRWTSEVSPTSVDRGPDDGETRAHDEHAPAEVRPRRHLEVIGVVNLVTGGFLLLGPVLWAVVVRGEALLWLPVLILLLGIPAALHAAAGVNCLWRDDRVGLILSTVTSGLVLVVLVPAALSDLPAAFSGDSGYHVWEIVAAPAWYGAILWLSINSLRRSGGRA